MMMNFLFFCLRFERIPIVSNLTSIQKNINFFLNFFILISQVLDISFIKVPITSFNGTEWYGKVKRKENDNLISE